MSRKQRLTKNQSNIIYKEPYAIIEQPTNATFIPKETMETNEEKKSVRQASKVVHAERKLVEDKKTKRQEKKASFGKIMENEAIGYAPAYV
jgi:hypothetical protein